MDTAQKSPRHWGWPQWLEEHLLPWAQPPRPAGGVDPQLWIVSGPPESGRDDLLRALRDRLLDRAGNGPSEVEWIERDPAETALEWQTRAALALTGGRSGADGTGPGTSGETAAPWTRPRRFFLVRDGDTIPLSWWRQQLPRWMSVHPEGCLVLTTGHPNESIADAFRLAGGAGRGIFHRSLGPWDGATVDRWREEFLAYDQRGTVELVKYSRGGWPGLLWALFEEKEKQISGESAIQRIVRDLGALSAPDRWLLLATAVAPSPARDFVEILLGREVTLIQWRAACLRWEQLGLIDRHHGWKAKNLPEIVREACAKLGEAPTRLLTDGLPEMGLLHRFLPSEEHRRLVRPLSQFLNVDRDALERLLGKPGKAIWEVVLEAGDIVAAGSGPRPLHRDFQRALQVYAKALPGEAIERFDARLRVIWEQRQGEVRSEIAKFGEKRTLLLKKAEEGRHELAGCEAEIGRLRQRLVNARRPRSRPAAGNKSKGSIPALGALGILAGLGWLYLSYLQHGAFHLYPTLGGLTLFGGGFLVLLGGDERASNRATPRVPSALLEERLETLLSGSRGQLRLAREAFDQSFSEANRLKAQIASLEEALNRPYIRPGS
jgi:hypothetical protein